MAHLICGSCGKPLLTTAVVCRHCRRLVHQQCRTDVFEMCNRCRDAEMAWLQNPNRRRRRRPTVGYRVERVEDSDE